MTKKEFIQKREEIKAQMANLEGAELDAKMRELNNLTSDFAAETAAMEREAVKTPAADANAIMREVVKAVREHRMSDDVVMKRTATDAITSSVIQSGEKTNMASAGIPLTINDLINPMEMGLIYGALGLKVATGVRGQIQWPCLDTTAEVSVGGELDKVETKTLDFSKITATPFKLGIAIKVSNEAINDASFDLVGVINEQMSKALGRVLNKRVLALSAPSVKSDFVGPLVSKKQTATFAGDVPTYKELKAIKGKVLGTGASMAGFCYVMDAAMFSALEAQPKDAGSGRFVIEGGKIDGDTVFVTDLAEYAGKVVAGCFGYEALNQHGDLHFITDIYSESKSNCTVFVLNGDFSLTNLVAGTKYPFVVAAKGAA